MRRELVACAVIGALLTASCDEKKKGGDGDAGSASASASVTPRASISILPGCHATTPGGSVVSIPSAAVSVAVAKGKALVVGTGDDGTNVPDATSPGRARASRVLLGTTGVHESKPEAIADALPTADDVSTFAAAVALGGEPTTLAYAVRRPTATACADGVLTARSFVPDGPRRELIAHVCRPTTTFRGAARAKLGIALASGPASGVVDAWILDDGKARLAPIEVLGAAGARDGAAAGARDGGAAGARDAGNPGPVSLDAPAVAAGASSVAAAYVVVRGTTRELHVARLTPARAPATVVVLDAQNVGSVTAAFEDDTLHVVWSSFVPEKNRYVLRWSKWPAGGSPSPAQSIGTGVLSAVAPSLAIDHGRFFLAWADGDDRATASVKVGASKHGLAFISGLATVVSTPGVAARDPEVALEGDTLFVAWKELAAVTEVRASAITCRE